MLNTCSLVIEQELEVGWENVSPREGEIIMDGQGREGHWDKGSNMERGEEQRSDYGEEQLK